MTLNSKKLDMYTTLNRMTSPRRILQKDYNWVNLEDEIAAKNGIWPNNVNMSDLIDSNFEKPVGSEANNNSYQPFPSEEVPSNTDLIDFNSKEIYRTLQENSEANTINRKEIDHLQNLHEQFSKDRKQNYHLTFTDRDMYYKTIEFKTPKVNRLFSHPSIESFKKSIKPFNNLENIESDQFSIPLYNSNTNDIFLGNIDSENDDTIYFDTKQNTHRNFDNIDISPRLSLNPKRNRSSFISSDYGNQKLLIKDDEEFLTGFLDIKNTQTNFKNIDIGRRVSIKPKTNRSYDKRFLKDSFEPKNTKINLDTIDARGKISIKPINNRSSFVSSNPKYLKLPIKDDEKLLPKLICLAVKIFITFLLASGLTKLSQSY